MKTFDIKEIKADEILALIIPEEIEFQLYRFDRIEEGIVYVKDYETGKPSELTFDVDGNCWDEEYEDCPLMIWDGGWNIDQLSENLGYSVDDRYFVEDIIIDEDNYNSLYKHWMSLEANYDVMRIFQEIEKDKRDEYNSRLESYNY